ncbi:hypothetical protein [Nocardia tengchongensis]
MSSMWRGRVSVPRDVAFVEELPRGETGKVLKRLLVDPDDGRPRDREISG